MLAGDCVTKVSSVQGVCAIVLCGSLVKPDIVVGWSDIDLIIFLRKAHDNTATLGHIRDNLKAAAKDIQIGLGVDVVCLEEFERTHKLGGRPLSMAFEVSQYAKIAFGTDPFQSLPDTALIRQKVGFEKTILIAGELHNWRRAFLSCDPCKSNFASWAGYSVKTTLRILRHELELNSTKPFTHEANLNAFLKRNVGHSAEEAFKRAIEIRKNWLDYQQKPRELEKYFSVITDTLVRYPNKAALPNGG